MSEGIPDASVRPRALHEKRILVTRPRAQSDSLCALLESFGAHALRLPAIEIAPLANTAHLDRAVAALAAGHYDWVIFTSANGVDAFWSRLVAMGHGAGAISGTQVAAIGPATRAALETRGVRAAFVPAEYLAVRIAAGLGKLDGRHVLLPRADLARPELGEELARRGARVDAVTAYHIQQPALDRAELDELQRGVDAVTFTSSSAVRNFVALVEGAATRWTTEAAIACIGPVTALTAGELGLPIAVVAREHTAEGLAQALVEYFEGHPL